MSFTGHQKDRFDLRLEPPIHERHLQLVFVVGNRADPTQNDAGAALRRVMDQQAVEGADFNIAETVHHFVQHLDALGDTEQRLLLFITQNGDDQFVEQRRAALDQIQVTVGNWVE